MALKGIRRPGQGGGGYLNGVSGVIESITFKAGKSGKNDNGPWTMYSGVLTIRPDGAEQSTTQFADAGFLRGDNTVSKDGRTIEGDDDYALDGSQPLGQLIISLFEGDGNRAPESLWEETNGGRNYDALVGVRVTFARVKDEAKTKRVGKRKVKDGPHAGKEFDQDMLLVSEVLALPAPKTKGKGAKATNGKVTKSAASAGDTTTVDSVLTAVLSRANDQTLSKDALSSAFIRYSVSQEFKALGLDRDAVRKTIASDEYLAGAAERNLIARDGSAIILTA